MSASRRLSAKLLAPTTIVPLLAASSFRGSSLLLSDEEQPVRAAVRVLVRMTDTAAKVRLLLLMVPVTIPNPDVEAVVTCTRRNAASGHVHPLHVRCPVPGRGALSHVARSTVARNAYTAVRHTC